MKTRATPSADVLHRMAVHARFDDYSQLSKGDLYDRLKVTREFPILFKFTILN